jgi:hypothetical protein
MSSTNKTISIDPDTFKIKDDRKTKKKTNNSSPKIQFKTQPTHKKKDGSIKYNKLLKYVRDKQDTNYNNLFNEKRKKTESSDTGSGISPKSEFEESLDFLNELRENNKKDSSRQLMENNLPRENPVFDYPSELSDMSRQDSSLAQSSFSSVPHQYTIKNHNYSPHEDVNIHFPIDLPNNVVEMSDNFYSDINQLPLFKIEPPPKYGVLKNGNLPTFRQFMKTQTNRMPPPSHPLTTTPPVIPREEFNNGIQTMYRRANLVNAVNKGTTQICTNKSEDSFKLNYTKRKKTIRRTFRVGKSKYYPQIGVIINNKTIRNECLTRKHLLKQTPIGEVKRILIKKGLIKVGSTAPNDVLRKMYESVNMICGEVQNHNTDILLHNYFNEGKL